MPFSCNVSVYVITMWRNRMARLPLELTPTRKTNRYVCIIYDMNSARIRRVNKEKISILIYWWKFALALNKPCETGYRGYMSSSLFVVPWYGQLLLLTLAQLRIKIYLNVYYNEQVHGKANNKQHMCHSFFLLHYMLQKLITSCNTIFVSR